MLYNPPFSDPQQGLHWRDHLPIHSACAAVPEMGRDGLIAVGNDIKAAGLRLPIVVHAEGDPCNPEFKLLDGRSRLDAMAAAGIEFKIERCREEPNRTSLRLNISGIQSGAPGGNVQVAHELSDAEIKALVLSLNVHRRHLDAEGRRAAIDALLKCDPGKSDRQIAEQTGSSPTTVGKRRKKAESVGDVSKMDTRTDSKGRKQPAKKSKPVTPKKIVGSELAQDIGDATQTPIAENTVEDDASASAEKRKAEHAAADMPPTDTKVEAGKPGKRRVTHVDILELWRALSPENRTRAIEGIGPKAYLAAMPESWWPLVAERLATRQALLRRETATITTLRHRRGR